MDGHPRGLPRVYVVGEKAMRWGSRAIAWATLAGLLVGGGCCLPMRCDAPGYGEVDGEIVEVVPMGRSLAGCRPQLGARALVARPPVLAKHLEPPLPPPPAPPAALLFHPVPTRPVFGPHATPAAHEVPLPEEPVAKPKVAEPLPPPDVEEPRSDTTRQDEPVKSRAVAWRAASRRGQGSGARGQ